MCVHIASPFESLIYRTTTQVLNIIVNSEYLYIFFNWNESQKVENRFYSHKFLFYQLLMVVAIEIVGNYTLTGIKIFPTLVCIVENRECIKRICIRLQCKKLIIQIIIYTDQKRVKKTVKNKNSILVCSFLRFYSTRVWSQCFLSTIKAYQFMTIISTYNSIFKMIADKGSASRVRDFLSYTLKFQRKCKKTFLNILNRPLH